VVETEDGDEIVVEETVVEIIEEETVGADEENE
jgi:hypothetical protein